MKSLFKKALAEGKSILTSGKIYQMYPELDKNAVQARIKRCLASGELIRLYKGVYLVNPELTHKSILEEQVAQAIDENAFLSELGALRLHNLIPEIIKYKTFLGTKNAKVDKKNIYFEIKKQPQELTTFGIHLMNLGGQEFRVADPIRAIMDAALALKLKPQNRSQILSYFGIEEDDVHDINWEVAFEYAKRYNKSAAKSLAYAMNA